MKESGLRIKQMALVCTHISTAQDMKANGSRISNMAMALSNGQMVLSSKGNMSKV